MARSGDQPAPRGLNTGGGWESATLREVRRAALGDDFAEEAESNSPQLLRSELRRFAGEMKVGQGQVFVDIGCGGGGPGLWVARETGTSLVGIDTLPSSIERAKERAHRLGMQQRSRFEVADMTMNGLGDAEFDAALSLVALMPVRDKPAALRETARILRRGARFVCTTVESLREPMIMDHRPLLVDAGFIVDVYEETPGWRDRMRRVAEEILAAEPQLVAELGHEAAETFVRYALRRPAEIERYQERLVLFVSHKA